MHIRKIPEARQTLFFFSIKIYMTYSRVVLHLVCVCVRARVYKTILLHSIHDDACEVYDAHIKYIFMYKCIAIFDHSVVVVDDFIEFLFLQQ